MYIPKNSYYEGTNTFLKGCSDLTGLKPKSTSGTPLGGWWPLEAEYLPKNKLSCGPLSRWVDFFKQSYLNGFYLNLLCSHWVFPCQHSLTNTCDDSFYLYHFWAGFMFFWQNLPVLLLVFRNSNKYSPFGSRNLYSKLQPRIPYRFFIHWKSKGQSPLILWCIPKSRVLHVSTNYIAAFLLGSSPLSLDVNNPWDGV